MRVAYPGPVGSFSSRAARVFGAPLEVRDFPGVVEAVTTGRADAGVLALENRWVGAVPDTLDLLAASPVFVTGRCVVAVHLCLAGAPGVRLDEVREVRSHPHALAQARGRLAKLGVATVSTSSTASAADQARGDVAALCSPALARARGLAVLMDDAGDRAGSRTRFVLVETRPREGRLGLYALEGGDVEGRVVGVRPSPRGGFRARVFVEAESVSLAGRVAGREVGRYERVAKIALASS